MWAGHTSEVQRNLVKRSIPVAIASFLQRAFGRSVGTHSNPEFGVGIEARAKRFLILLNKEEKSLTFRIALENLRREFDLLMEESALVPEGLELQSKVVELADRHEIADLLVREMLTQPPVVKLFNNILAKARKVGAPEVQIDFNAKGDTFPVLLNTGSNWAEMMRVPASLEEPLRGAIARVEAIGFAVLAPRLEQNHLLPTGLRFGWIDRQRLAISIDPPASLLE